MKKIIFNTLHTIDKLTTLRKMGKHVEEEYNVNQAKFQKFIDEIDDGYCYDNATMDQRIAELNIILAKSDELYEQIVMIDKLLTETKAQLEN